MSHLKLRIPAILFSIFCLTYMGLAEEVVKYFPKPGDLKYTYGQHKPVMKIKPGTVIISSTEDCYDGKVKKPSDKPSEVVDLWHDNPLTGPFYIQGAEMGVASIMSIPSTLISWRFILEKSSQPGPMESAVIHQDSELSPGQNIPPSSSLPCQSLSGGMKLTKKRARSNIRLSKEI